MIQDYRHVHIQSGNGEKVTNRANSHKFYAYNLQYQRSANKLFYLIALVTIFMTGNTPLVAKIGRNGPSYTPHCRHRPKDGINADVYKISKKAFKENLVAGNP
jgi:hypothetical protein